MSQKITCPNPECKLVFDMEEGLTSHLKTLQENYLKKIETQEKDKRKKDLERYKSLEGKNLENEAKIKKFNEEKETDIKNAVNVATKAKDKEYKEHYQSIYETKLKEQKENLNEQNSEKQKLWELKEKRYIATVEDLQKKMTQGTTVDQGSSGEMQLGDFLKKVFKDKKDTISEYAKGVAGGDWLQEIIENDFTISKILYERKNTRNWSNDWIKKLQDDMKDSKSDVGIIFTKTTPKDFPKDVSWDHKGNIFVCKYDFTALRALATMQRWYLSEKNKQNESNKENVLSAIKFIESPEVTNILMQQINISEKKKKKLELTKKNIDDVIELNDNSDTIIEELFKEIEKIGIEAFIIKWKKIKNKK